MEPWPASGRILEQRFARDILILSSSCAVKPSPLLPSYEMNRSTTTTTPSARVKLVKYISGTFNCSFNYQFELNNSKRRSIFVEYLLYYIFQYTITIFTIEQSNKKLRARPSNIFIFFYKSMKKIKIYWPTNSDWRSLSVPPGWNYDAMWGSGWVKNLDAYRDGH